MLACIAFDSFKLSQSLLFVLRFVLNIGSCQSLFEIAPIWVITKSLECGVGPMLHASNETDVVENRS